MLTRLLKVAPLALLAACASTMKVARTNDPNAIPKETSGIPFYSKKAVRVQHTSYVQRWSDLRLSLREEEITKPVDGTAEKVRILRSDSRETRVLLADVTSAARLRELHQVLSLPAVTTKDEVGKRYDAIAAAMNALQPATEPQLFDPPVATVLLAGNIVLDTVIVDYNERFYLNGAMPWFGSSTIATELLADGTLSKSTGTVESTAGTAVKDLLATVLAPLPVKELLTKKWELEQATPADTTVKAKPMGVKPSRPRPVPQVSYRVVAELERSAGRTIWEFTRKDLAVADSPIPFDLKANSWTRAEQAAQPVAPPKSAPDASKISFEGAVSLPKKPN